MVGSASVYCLKPFGIVKKEQRCDRGVHNCDKFRGITETHVIIYKFLFFGYEPLWLSVTLESSIIHAAARCCKTPRPLK